MTSIPEAAEPQETVTDFAHICVLENPYSGYFVEFRVIGELKLGTSISQRPNQPVYFNYLTLITYVRVANRKSMH